MSEAAVSPQEAKRIAEEVRKSFNQKPTNQQEDQNIRSNLGQHKGRNQVRSVALMLQQSSGRTGFLSCCPLSLLTPKQYTNMK